MKTIYLVRHAKAMDKSIFNSRQEDVERILTEAGIKDAEQMGQRLFSMKIKPAVIISSHAARALETARIIAMNIKYDRKKIIVNQNVYAASSEKLLQLLKETKDSYSSIMLVGHNSAFNELLWALCETNIKNIPKGGVVGIAIPADSWSKIVAKCGTLLFFDSPKNQ